ncbi:MAG TPA: oxidoreductase [Pseudolabrys sp.]|nr:oxidoreductase [Pseudolabrys sp.]
MVAITLPHPTVDAIDAHYQARQENRPPQRLTARLLTGCERAGWYAFRWAHQPPTFAPHHARANMARAEAMNELGQCLSDIGVTVSRVDPKTYQVRDLIAIDGHYRQKIAGTAIGLLEAPKTEHFLYLDQLPAKAVAQIQRHGLVEARPDRIAPIQIGMHLLGLNRTFYMVRNKDTDELWSERVEYNAGHAVALLAKGERIVAASVPPVKVSDDPQNWQCRNCPAVDICHFNQFAPRNCRTCLHATPVGGGEWHCARHNRELSVQDQASGCPNHLYLPGLVPGTPDDADEANETVTYVLGDGRLWIDGEGRVA